ncbi:hypothetical protein BGZ65_009473, partial [Modicella reniformis]
MFNPREAVLTSLIRLATEAGSAQQLYSNGAITQCIHLLQDIQKKVDCLTHQLEDLEGEQGHGGP